jgi:pilus assembly protein Flp/PilA
MIKRFVANECGQGMVEYSLILMLVALVVIGGLTLLGGNVATFFTNASNIFH